MLCSSSSSHDGFSFPEAGIKSLQSAISCAHSWGFSPPQRVKGCFFYIVLWCNLSSKNFMILLR